LGQKVKWATNCRSTWDDRVRPKNGASETKIEAQETPKKKRAAPGPKKFRCLLCKNCHYYREDRFKQHLADVHRFNIKLTCIFCCKTCESADHLTVHVSTFHKDETCAFRKPEIIFAPCEICGKLFPEKNLKSHSRAHSNEKNILCPVCGYRTKYQSGMTSHMKTHENQRRNRDFICNDCGKVYNFRRSFIVHIQDKHLFKRRYPCTICPKTFTTPSSLTIHYRIHRGELKHTCQFCNVAYVTNASLVRHLLKQHNFLSFKCELCGLSFEKLGELKEHNESLHYSKN
jgi:transcription elongation factor Elf1